MTEPGRGQENICLVCGNTLEPAAFHCGHCGGPMEISPAESGVVNAEDQPAGADRGNDLSPEANCLAVDESQQESGLIEKNTGRKAALREPLIPDRLLMVLQYETDGEAEPVKDTSPRGLLALIGAAVGPSPLARLLFILLMFVSMACGYILGDRLWAEEKRKVIYIPRINFELKQLWPENKTASLTGKTASHKSDLSQPAPRLIDKVVVPREEVMGGQEEAKNESSGAAGSGIASNGAETESGAGVNKSEPGKKPPAEGINKTESATGNSGNTGPKPAPASTAGTPKMTSAPAVTAHDILLLKQAVAAAQKNYLLSLSASGENTSQAEKIYRQNTARLGHALYSFYTSGGRNNAEIARQEMRLLMVELWGWGTPGVEREIERGVSTVR